MICYGRYKNCGYYLFGSSKVKKLKSPIITTKRYSKEEWLEEIKSKIGEAFLMTKSDVDF